MTATAETQKLADETYHTHMETVGLTLFMLGPLGQLAERQRLLMGASIPGLIKVGDGLSRLWKPKDQKRWERVRGELEARFAEQQEALPPLPTFEEATPQGIADVVNEMFPRSAESTKAQQEAE